MVWKSNASTPIIGPGPDWIWVTGQVLDDNGVPEENRDSLMVDFQPADDLPPGYFPIVRAKWVKVEH